MATAPQYLDWQAYLHLPETLRRYDIVDGVLKYMSPSPDWDHQKTLRATFVAVHRHVTRYRLGEVMFAPLDVIISKGPLRVRQPDLLFISRERLGIVRHQVHGGPDLVVEILSPGNTRRHVQQKVEDYASAGVREAWILDPQGRRVTVFHLEKNTLREAAAYRPGERLRSRVLSRLALPVDRLFS